MSNYIEYNDKIAFHPGYYIKEIIDESGITQEDFAKRLAYYWSELNVLHPFREGNGRTTREFIRQIALKYNYNLNLQNFTAQEILDASIKSIVDTQDLENIVNKCLEHK